jgi:hypothetical protein
MTDRARPRSSGPGRAVVDVDGAAAGMAARLAHKVTDAHLE